MTRWNWSKLDEVVISEHGEGGTPFTDLVREIFSSGRKLIVCFVYEIYRYIDQIIYPTYLAVSWYKNMFAQFLWIKLFTSQFWNKNLRAKSCFLLTECWAVLCALSSFSTLSQHSLTSTQTEILNISDVHSIILTRTVQGSPIHCSGYWYERYLKN